MIKVLSSELHHLTEQTGEREKRGEIKVMADSAISWASIQVTDRVKKNIFFGHAHAL